VILIDALLMAFSAVQSVLGILSWTMTHNLLGLATADTGEATAYLGLQ